MIKRIIEGAAILFLALAAFFIFKNYTASKELSTAKETFKADKERLQNDITNLVEEKDFYKKKALREEVEAERIKGDMKALKEDLTAAKNESKLWASKIEKMSDNDVVVDTRKVLEVDEGEVIQNSLGVQFSLSAMRKNYAKLKECQDFSLVIVPKQDKLLEGKDRVIEVQGKAIIDGKEALSKCELSLVKYGDLQIKYDSLLDVYERSNRWLKVTVGATVVAIVVIGGIILFAK